MAGHLLRHRLGLSRRRLQQTFPQHNIIAVFDDHAFLDYGDELVRVANLALQCFPELLAS